MDKKQLIAVGVVFALGLALGRFSLPAKVITKSETSTKSQDHKDVVDRSVIVKTETKKPDGTDVIVTETKKNVDTKDSLAIQSDTLKSKETDYDTRRLLVSAIAAARPFSGDKGIAYGGSVSYRVLGPVTAGLMGLSDGTVGIQLGLMF